MLSYAEANSSYGLGSGFTGKKKTTDYAQVQGAFTCIDDVYGGNGWWWLRSPNSSYSYGARGVNEGGYISSGGYFYVNRTDGGVVPALQIKLS